MNNPNTKNEILEQFAEEFGHDVDGSTNWQLIRQLKWLSPKLQEVERIAKDEMLKEIASYNVAFCNKCKSLFKAEHKDCKLAQLKGEDK